MSDLHAKALRAAEWLNPQEIISLAEVRGWQDTAELHIPTEEEAPDICLEMMGQFMNELDTAEDEGVEWNEWVTVQDGNFTVSVNN